jgi:polar amino acid transport system permease protein
VEAADMATPTDRVMTKVRDLDGENPAPEPDDERVLSRPRYGRWVAAIVLVALLVLVIRQFAVADIKWSEVPHYLFSKAILEGLWGTVWLTVLAMLVGIAVGTVIAIMALSDNVVLRTTARFYLWLLRGIPTLVQLLIWFNIALVVKNVSIPGIYSGSTNELVTPLVAAVLGLGLSEGANMGEIMRSGILSVDRGQSLAATALGYTSSQTMRRIVLPQALKVIIPPTGNEVINMTKYTSLAYAVSYSELLNKATAIYSGNFEVVELLFTITVWYLVLTSLLMWVQRRIERRLAAAGGPVMRRRVWLARLRTARG